MVQVFRIASKKYVDDLTGTGAKIHGGRWNKKGSPMLYTSQSISLALLEILVHFDGLTIPKDLHLISLSFPEKLTTDFQYSKFKKLNKSGNSETRFKDAGEKWLAECSSAVLKVPSVIVPAEFNYLISPLHSDFSKLKKVKVEPLDFDERLFK